MRQQENKKENFRENSTKLTWIPKVYNYAERTGNLKAEAVGVVSGEKHFPVFEDRMVFKPLTKSKPFSTPLFACAEVFWSWVIDTYFVPAPLYQLAFCRGYEAECEKYYDYGTVSPMIYEEGEHLRAQQRRHSERQYAQGVCRKRPGGGRRDSRRWSRCR